MNKNEILRKFPELHEGMVTRTMEGASLGKIAYLSEDHLNVEKGVFFPKDYAIGYEDITEIRGGEVLLRRNREELLATDQLPPLDSGIQKGGFNNQVFDESPIGLDEIALRDSDQPISDGDQIPDQVKPWGRKATA